MPTFTPDATSSTGSAYDFMDHFATASSFNLSNNYVNSLAIKYGVASTGSFKSRPSSAWIFDRSQQVLDLLRSDVDLDSVQLSIAGVFDLIAGMADPVGESVSSLAYLSTATPDSQYVSPVWMRWVTSSVAKERWEPEIDEMYDRLVGE